MADEVIEKETNWFSAALSILEAEFEKSKLQVYQDTLLCKRSMMELELLCKNEQLQKNVRVNSKLKEQGSQLQVATASGERRRIRRPDSLIYPSRKCHENLLADRNVLLNLLFKIVCICFLFRNS